MSRTTQTCPQPGSPSQCCLEILAHEPSQNHEPLSQGEHHATLLSIQFESGVPRLEQFGRELIRDHLLSFACKYSNRQSLNIDYYGLEQLAKAARTVYSTPRYQKRGEFGELILHAILESFFGTTVAVAKLAFKTARNDTVKGFDAVHVIERDGDLELWLGEAKFYTDANRAVSDLITELNEHLGDEYLRDEFTPITTMLDDSQSHTAALRLLLGTKNTLDNIKAKLVVPALITYESSSMAAITEHSDTSTQALSSETLKILENFGRKIGRIGDQIRIQLIILPLQSKEKLIEELHNRLNHYKEL